MIVKRLAIMLLCITMVAGCKKQTEIVLVNNSDQEIPDYPVMLTKKEFVKLVGEIPENKLPVFHGKGGKAISYQLDDMDQDTAWDEVAFVYDLSPRSENVISVSFVDSNDVPEFENRTNIRFVKKKNPGKELKKAERLRTFDNTVTQQVFQMEGPAWENDKVGFRNYFDQRNGMDIFGKTTHEMALDKAGIEGQDYHALDDWGMDILKVGSSLGAGGIALMAGDKLLRVGPDGKGSFVRVTEGPVRSVFKLIFEEIMINEQYYTITHTITIWAGQYGYHSHLSVKGAQQGDKLVAGFVNADSDSLIINKYERYVSMATYGKQAINGDKLGMALLVPKNYFLEDCKAPDGGEGIIKSYYAMMYIPTGQPVEYWFYAGWEQSDEIFSSRDGFTRYIKKQTDIKNADVGLLRKK